MGNCCLYLTSIIENDESIGWLADQCLQPLHTLLNLSGSKAVRIFHVDRKLNRVREVESSPSFEWTLTKVIEVALSILFVILATLGAIILKTVAILCNEDYAEKTKILANSAIFKIKPKEKKVGKQEHFGRLSNKVISQTLCPLLGLEDLARFQSVSRTTWQLSHSMQREVILKYRKGLRGVQVDADSHSYAALIADCRLHAKKVHYDRFFVSDGEQSGTRQFSELFGGIDTILRLPLFAMKGNVSDREVEEFAHSSDFKNKPSIFRLQVQWEYEKEQSEAIMIKYTLFAPKEELSGIYTRHPDAVWHDYIRLKYFSSTPSNGFWTASDARHTDSFAPAGLRESLRYPQGPLNWKSVLDCHNEADRLKKLLKNERIGLFRAQEMEWPRHTQAISQLPSYVLKSVHRKSHDVRLFVDIPIALGHISLEEMFKTMRVVLQRGDRHDHSIPHPNAEFVHAVTFW